MAIGAVLFIGSQHAMFVFTVIQTTLNVNDFNSRFSLSFRLWMWSFYLLVFWFLSIITFLTVVNRSYKKWGLGCRTCWLIERQIFLLALFLYFFFLDIRIRKANQTKKTALFFRLNNKLLELKLFKVFNCWSVVKNSKNILKSIYVRRKIIITRVLTSYT